MPDQTTDTAGEIRRLASDLGSYRAKVAEMSREIARLRDDLESAERYMNRDRQQAIRATTGRDEARRDLLRLYRALGVVAETDIDDAEAEATAIYDERHQLRAQLARAVVLPADWREQIRAADYLQPHPGAQRKAIELIESWTAHPARETDTPRVRAVIDQYAAEDPGDGDYGDVTRDQIVPEAMDALRAVAGFSGETDRRIVAALRKAERPEGEARQTPADEDPESWRQNRARGWYRDIGYAFQRILGEHRYDDRQRGSKPDDPGWHPCSCGWEGYWSAFHPHVADHLRATVVDAGLLAASPSDLPVSPNLGEDPAFGGSVTLTPAPKEPQTSACGTGCGAVHRPDCDASETYNRPAEEPGETR